MISLGLAEKRSALELESVASNNIHASIPEIEGAQLKDGKILNGGRETYYSTLPLQGIEEALKNAGVSVNTSSLQATTSVIISSSGS